MAALAVLGKEPDKGARREVAIWGSVGDDRFYVLRHNHRFYHHFVELKMIDAEAVWHKCSNPFFPRRTVDGGWTKLVGQTWRRMRPDGKWEYRQDEETFDEWSFRQW